MLGCGACFAGVTQPLRLFFSKWGWQCQIRRDPGWGCVAAAGTGWAPLWSSAHGAPAVLQVPSPVLVGPDIPSSLPECGSGALGGGRSAACGGGGVLALHFNGFLLIRFCTHAWGVISAASGDKRENNGIVIPGVQMFILPPLPLLSRGDGINRTCLLNVSASFCARGQQAITTSCSGTVITTRGGRGGLCGGWGARSGRAWGGGLPAPGVQDPGWGHGSQGRGPAGSRGCHRVPWTVVCPSTQERLDGIKQPQKVFKKPCSKPGRKRSQRTKAGLPGSQEHGQRGTKGPVPQD